MSRHRTTGRARRWAGGIGTAAAAAAMIGMGTAHADEGSVPADIGLLNTAQTDIAEAFSLSGHTNADAGFFPELEAIQTPLLSSDNCSPPTKVSSPPTKPVTSAATSTHSTSQ